MGLQDHNFGSRFFLGKDRTARFWPEGLWMGFGLWEDNQELHPEKKIVCVGIVFKRLFLRVESSISKLY